MADTPPITVSNAIALPMDERIAAYERMGLFLQNPPVPPTPDYSRDPSLAAILKAAALPRERPIEEAREEVRRLARERGWF